MAAFQHDCGCFPGTLLTQHPVLLRFYGSLTCACARRLHTIICLQAPSGSRPDVSDQLLAYCAAYKGCQQEVTAAMLRQVQEQQQQLARQGRQLEEQQQQLAQQGRQLEEQHAQLAAARVHASQTAELWARVQALEALLLQQK